jgi:hypothetical protein
MSLRSASPGYDYSMVDTREKAQRLVQLGELVALPMLPALFGGDETRIENIVFVPPSIARRKEQIDEETILPRIEAGARVDYHVRPENDEVSFVPVALNVIAYCPEPLVYRLAIWSRTGA